MAKSYKYKLEIIIQTSQDEKDKLKDMVKTVLEDRLDRRSYTTREIERINSFKIEKVE